MAIFAVISVALIGLLTQSTAFLEKGNSGAEIQDVLEAADLMFADDFANVYIQPSSREGEPDVRFHCDRAAFHVRGDADQPVWTPRLMFVRTLRGEIADPVTRDAGRIPGAPGRLDGVDDEREAAEGELRAPGGKMEVMYSLLPNKKEDDPAIGVLHRGTRTPLGGKGSLLPWEPFSEKAKEGHRQGPRSREEYAASLRPVMAGILHLSFEFWSRHTNPKLADLFSDGASGRHPPSQDGGGLSPTWDSTRGILPRGITPDTFFLAAGEESLARPLDDVFPSKIRVTLVVERVGKDAKVGELQAAISEDDTTIPVDDSTFARGADLADRYIKIGDEWMRWSSRTRRSFQVEERGARGTVRRSHVPGSVVHAGATLIRDYPVPVHRENWND